MFKLYVCQKKNQTLVSAGKGTPRCAWIGSGCDPLLGLPQNVLHREKDPRTARRLLTARVARHARSAPRGTPTLERSIQCHPKSGIPHCILTHRWYSHSVASILFLRIFRRHAGKMSVAVTAKLISTHGIYSRRRSSSFFFSLPRIQSRDLWSSRVL